MSEARALTNPVGNGVATIVVAKWVKELDHKKLNDTLNNRTSEDKTPVYPLNPHKCPYSLVGMRAPAHNNRSYLS